MLSVCEALGDARMLVVEDDANIREMMAYTFKTRGARPVCVESGE